jgi:hypothetical protein
MSSGGGGGGNRQDNRQRGNAAQLLEKYKSMARDAQLGGDRVQTEYYLQFADHYFRVLGESRSRFDEQRRGRDDEEGDEDEGMEMAEADHESEAEADDRPQRREQRDRDERPRDRDERPREREARDRDERPRDRDERPARRERPERGNGRLRSAENDGDGGERIAFDVLPPAIGADEPVTMAPQDSEEEVAPPRRRTRRPRADDSDTDIAPAA